MKEVQELVSERLACKGL